MAIRDCSDDHELFPEFLRRLDDFLLLSNGPTNYKTELLTSLSQCVANNPEACISHWQQMYRAHLHSSSKLLCHLDGNWKALMKSKHFNEVTNLQNFAELLDAFQGYNTTCTAQKDGLKESLKSCKSLLAKLSSELHGNKGWFPWKCGSILLLVGIISLVNMDVNKNGSFKRSHTGLFLQDIGIYNQTIEYYEFSFELYLVGKEWAQVKFPMYYKSAKENAGPFITTLNTKLTMGWGEGKKFVSHLMEKANNYLPGLKEKWMVISNDMSRIGNDVFDWLYKTSNLVIEWLILYTQTAVNFLKEMYEATILCIQDIINGKIDLADVYVGIQKLIESAVVRAGKFYEYVLGQVKVIMK